MATEEHLKFVEAAADDHFDDQALLKLALTAAGAELNKPNGNRSLAQIGVGAVGFVVTLAGLEVNAASNDINNLKAYLIDKSHWASAAERAGLAKCIKLSDAARGEASKRHLSMALSAIVGAAYQDSESLKVVAKVIRRFMLEHPRHDSGSPPADPVTRQSAGSQQRASTSAYKDLFNAWRQLQQSPGRTTTNVAEVQRVGSEQLLDTDGAAVSDSTTDGDTLLPEFVDEETESDGPRSSNGRAVPLAIQADPLTRTSIGDEEAHIEPLQVSSSPFFSDSARPIALPVTPLHDLDLSSNYDDLLTGTALDPSFLEAEMDGIVMQQHGPSTEILSVRSLSERGASVSMNVESAPLVDSDQGLCSPQRQTSGSAEINLTGRQSRQIPAPKKRKLSKISVGYSAALSSYVEKERKRYEENGRQYPQDKFLTGEIVESFRGHEEEFQDLLQLHLGICSPEAVATLQKAVVSYRAGLAPRLSTSSNNLTAARRFELIEMIEDQEDYLTLFKRCHILKLYEDHPGAGSWVTCSGVRPVESRAGNPRHNADADATTALLKEIYPNLTKEHPDYERRYVKTRQIRKLGRRFRLLKDRFGEGVLGLMRCAELQATESLTVNITDAMLSDCREDRFEQAVELLDKTQGEWIRQCSKAVAPIIACVLSETLSSSPQFTLERARLGRILQLPKGSQELLALI